MNKEEVLKLARLARIDISDEEALGLTHEFDSILGYVGEVKSAVGHGESPGLSYPVKNVMREDVKCHDSSVYTELLLNQAPAREGSYIKVKKIL